MSRANSENRLRAEVRYRAADPVRYPICLATFGMSFGPARGRSRQSKCRLRTAAVGDQRHLLPSTAAPTTASNSSSAGVIPNRTMLHRRELQSVSLTRNDGSVMAGPCQLNSAEPRPVRPLLPTVWPAVNNVVRQNGVHCRTARRSTRQQRHRVFEAAVCSLHALHCCGRAMPTSGQVFIWQSLDACGLSNISWRSLVPALALFMARHALTILQIPNASTPRY